MTSRMRLALFFATMALATKAWDATNSDDDPDGFKAALKDDQAKFPEPIDKALRCQACKVIAENIQVHALDLKQKKKGATIKYGKRTFPYFGSEMMAVDMMENVCVHVVKMKNFTIDLYEKVVEHNIHRKFTPANKYDASMDVNAGISTKGSFQVQYLRVFNSLLKQCMGYVDEFEQEMVEFIFEEISPKHLLSKELCIEITGHCKSDELDKYLQRSAKTEVGTRLGGMLAGKEVPPPTDGTKPADNTKPEKKKKIKKKKKKKKKKKRRRKKKRNTKSPKEL